MKAIILAALATAMIGSGGFAQNIRQGGQFIDVPPCHWAAVATQRLGELGIFQGIPASQAELAQNALRQVFEGLKCGDAAWAGRFVTGQALGFAQAAGSGALKGFTLNIGQTRVTGSAAQILYRVTLTYTDGGGASRTIIRDASANLARDPELGWRVRYLSLLSLRVSLFPE